jgi:hypothetical protein
MLQQPLQQQLLHEQRRDAPRNTLLNTSFHAGSPSLVFPGGRGGEAVGVCTHTLTHTHAGGTTQYASSSDPFISALMFSDSYPAFPHDPSLEFVHDATCTVTPNYPCNSSQAPFWDGGCRQLVGDQALELEGGGGGVSLWGQEEVALQKMSREQFQEQQLRRQLQQMAQQQQQQQQQRIYLQQQHQHQQPDRIN